MPISWVPLADIDAIVPSVASRIVVSIFGPRPFSTMTVEILTVSPVVVVSIVPDFRPCATNNLRTFTVAAGAAAGAAHR